MKPYFSLTNTIFNNIDMNEWDYATLVAIACNNLPFVSNAESKTTEIETSYVSTETLLDTLKIENDNRKRNRDKINESLKKLAKASVVKVVDVKEIAKRKYFKFSQEVSKTGANQGFSSITAEEFEKIVFGIEKATDKVKTLACYVSIAHRVFRATKTEKDANFNWSSNLSNYICWDTLETIGKNYNTGRKAVAKTVEMLIEVEAIAVKTVRRKDKNKEQKLIFAKFSDKDELYAYVAEQIASGEYLKANDKVAKAEVIEVTEIAVVNEVADDVVEEQLQALTSNNADEVVKERIEPIKAIKVEKKEDKAKVINITNDDRIKRMEALASFQNVKNVDEREEESKASVDLLAGHRPEKITTV